MQFTLTHFHGIFRCLGPGVTRFLESQTSVETIHIFSTEPSEAQLPVFAPTSFPNLKTLIIGPGPALPFLRTSANVRNLRMKYEGSLRSQNRNRTKRVWHPCAYSHASHYPPPARWHCSFPSLNGQADMPTPMGCLQGSHTLPGTLVHRSTMPFSSEIAPLFYAIPTLESVEYKYGPMHDAGIRWYRDAPSPVSVRWLRNRRSGLPIGRRTGNHFGGVLMNNSRGSHLLQLSITPRHSLQAWGLCQRRLRIMPAMGRKLGKYPSLYSLFYPVSEVQELMSTSALSNIPLSYFFVHPSRTLKPMESTVSIQFC
ncbi:hypothetical protein PTI98_013505 [Pleurotus ostreatus]|nr:hypothetical protein PTI98_013505 [Pleurotus ostreatus]